MRRGSEGGNQAHEMEVINAGEGKQNREDKGEGRTEGLGIRTKHPGKTRDNVK